MTTNAVNASHISLAFQALRELGPKQLGLYALYRVGLKSGYFRRQSAARRQAAAKRAHPSLTVHPVLDLPAPAEILAVIGETGLSRLRAEADEIAEGRAPMFGGPPRPLVLSIPGARRHWTAYETGKADFPSLPHPPFPNSRDPKFIWEPARFGWAFTLGRAYHLSGDERYPKAFWRHFETFTAGNPPDLGPNWVSAQEVALRLIALTFAAQIFASSPHSTRIRCSQLAAAIAEHAARIPPTLIYARAQNNNHLLSEAAGLITAALALPGHPEAPRWGKLGWQWFGYGLRTQIAADGAYMQHSANYHRLALQLAVWVSSIRAQGAARGGNRMPEPWQLPLAAATRWLLALVDSESGRAPNLGPNDGAYILPLTVLPFHDYRPALQAAARAFLGQPAFEPGIWDEMGRWLKVTDDPPKAQPATSPPITLHSAHAWGYLRAARFRDRPGHADQLHLDLWWRGLNIAQDAGTYLYNAPPPWDNALTRTAIHNTVTVNGREQMTRAGRFLYLNWAQATVIARQRAEDGAWQRVTARHDGYRRLGVIHQRTVTAYQDQDRWVVEDALLPAGRGVPSGTPTARLHWLLPDWEFTVENGQSGQSRGAHTVKLSLHAPLGTVDLAVQSSASDVQFALLRAGEQLHGAGTADPTWGWFSPTYGVKRPALSFAVTASSALPFTFTTEFTFALQK